MSSIVTLGYSPNDFFYVDAQNQGIMPKTGQCQNLISTYTDAKCGAGSGGFIDNSFNCIQKELCVNWKKANEITEIENQHGGADKKFTDASMTHDIALMDIINLGIGIFFAMAIIYRNRNPG